MKRLKNHIYIVVTLWVVSSCGLFGAKFDPIPEYPVASTNVASDSIVFLEPKDISFNISRLRSLDFGVDSLNRDLVQEQIFTKPSGPDDWNYNDFYSLSYWKCSSCEKISVLDENNSQGQEVYFEKLPLEINYTQLIGQLDFQGANDKSYSLLSFSTGPDYELTGRFVSGMLSLALLEKNETWKIKQFNLVVNYQGSFQRASGIDSLIELPSGLPLFIIRGGVANGVSVDEYWPIYENIYFIDYQDLKQVIQITNAVCWINGDEDLGSKWSTHVVEIKQVGDQEQMELQTSGRLDKERMWGLPEGISQEVYLKLPKLSNFELKTTYTFQAGKWNKTQTILEIWTSDSNKREKYILQE